MQYLTIAAYNVENRSVNQDFMQLHPDIEKVISKKFKRVVAGGKGSKPVSILFSKRLQKFIACLLKVRTDFNLAPD